MAGRRDRRRDRRSEARGAAMEPDSAGAEAGMEGAGGDPYRRPARRTQWLLSALAHHYGLDRGVENEIVVLATGLDQYLQEVFHHLDCRGAGRLPRADFRALCAVLGLRAEGATAAGEAAVDVNSRAVTTGDAAAELATDRDSDTSAATSAPLRGPGCPAALSASTSRRRSACAVRAAAAARPARLAPTAVLTASALRGWRRRIAACASWWRTCALRCRAVMRAA